MGKKINLEQRDKKGNNQLIDENNAEQSEHNFLKFIFILLGYFIALGSAFLAIGITEKNLSASKIEKSLIEILITLTALALIVIVYRQIYQRVFPQSKVYSFKKIDATLLWAIFLIFPLIVFLKVLVMNFFSDEEVEFFFLDKSGGKEEILKLLLDLPLAAIIAPVLEEFSYRFIALSAYKTNLGKILAASITILCFSLLHGSSFLIVFFDALLFTIVYFWSKNMTATVVLHIANNLSASLLPLFSYTSIYFYPEIEIGVMGISLPVFVFIVICFVLGVFLLFKSRKKCNNKK